MSKMFNKMRSRSPSPCPSPVQGFVSSLRRASSPSKDKYKAMIESQEPIIARGVLTMSGGFQDFRSSPYPMEKSDSYDSDCKTPSLSSSSRSDSYDSNDSIVDPLGAKSQRRFVKIPRKALTTVINQLSPRLSKKLMNAEKKHESAPQNPMWPNVMTTYARGVSTTPIQSLVVPAQPSLTAMKARALLDEKRNFRAALQMLAQDVNSKNQTQSDDDSSSCSSSPYNSDQEDQEDQFDTPSTHLSSNNNNYEPAEEIAENLKKFSMQNADGATGCDVFPINPTISVTNASPSPNRDNAVDVDFQGESIFDALDLDTVPTLSVEELAHQGITEVRNVHLYREYIILETGPPSESVFV